MIILCILGEQPGTNDIMAILYSRSLESGVTQVSVSGV
jgi:hypothetical protein